MLPRLADRAPECSHTTPISPGLLRFLNFLLRRPHAAGTSPKAGHGAHAAGYLSPSPPVLRGVTTKSTHRLPHCEQLSTLAQSGTARSAPCRSAWSPGSRSATRRQLLHQTRNSRCALAVVPSVAGPDSPSRRRSLISGG